ncbi:MAG TPA: hypothetical protein VGN05_01385 [Parvibaculum sp.]|jgi:hypothetical protein
MSMVSDWMGSSATERKRRMLLVSFVAMGLLVAIAGVWLLPAGQNMAGESANVSAASVDGFRTAQFGSDEKAVRAAITKDFDKSGDAIKIIDNPVERTRVLVVRSDNLFADSTQAEIGYVFGYKSKALIQVNILWGTPLTPAVTQSQLAAMAATLTRYFAAQGFAAHRVTRNKKLGNGGVLVFQGTDAKGHMVQLVQRMEVAKGDADKKRMTLRLAYIADPKQPDIFKIAKGAF